jgi:hypothetical protein
MGLQQALLQGIQVQQAQLQRVQMGQQVLQEYLKVGQRGMP